MKNSFLTLLTITLLLLNLPFFEKAAYGAVDQILNDNFFLNPAELSLIKKGQLITGSVFIASQLKFTGITSLSTGSTKSRVNDSLPYTLIAYRFSDRFVTGITVTPSAYGHIEWPINSLVREISTKTKLIYYRIGTQSSYQFTDKLAFGIGVNLEYNKLAELDFVVSNMGNQVNKISGLNYTGDIGLLYKFNSINYLTMALYTQVNTFGSGTSSLGATTANNFALNITEAAVASIGLQHWINDNWFLEEKVYWSGWSLEKKITFINTTTGNSISPTNWGNTWSLQALTRFTTTKKLALLGSIIYETNPIPISTNNIGYPLSPVSSIAAGIDLTLQEGFSTQLLCSYGVFIPNAKINNTSSKGSIAGNFQGIVIQATFKS